MENHFLVDSEYLSEKALAKKHQLENDPSSRKNHMEYLPGMEKIESNVCANVMKQMNSYDYSIYTAKDVKAALEHETCSIEDFKALLSPAAEPFLEQMAEKARLETSKHFGNTVYLFTPLYIANYCENYCVYCGFNCYNHIKRMKLSMEQIEKEMKVIAKTIRRDKNETIYNLQKFDDEIAQLDQDVAEINRKKKEALTTFDTVTRTIISDEITANNKEEIGRMEDDLASLSEKLRSTRTAAKEKSLFITDNYEVYIGKGYMTSEKLQALADIVRSGAASNISDAIAIYKSQEETAK